MSLILEALRKSEAERRRGEVPGLRVELPPLAPRARRGMPAWAWFALAGVALAPVLAFVVLRGVDPAPADPVRGAASQDTAAPVDARPAGAAATADVDAGMDTLPRVERIVAPAPGPAPVPAQPPAVVAATPTPTPGATPRATAAAADIPRTPAPSAAAPADPPPPRPAAATPAPLPANDLPRIAELPASQRERLPALKMTMHMWNADPTRRFVIVDGQRLVEGDRVGEATVRTIDADGVVLDLDGQPLRLPLR